MAPLVRTWLVVLIASGVAMVAFLWLGSIYPRWLLVAVSIALGGTILMKALIGEEIYESRPHLFAAVLITWAVLGLMWVGYYLHHGHWPL